MASANAETEVERPEYDATAEELLRPLFDGWIQGLTGYFLTYEKCMNALREYEKMIGSRMVVLKRTKGFSDPITHPVYEQQGKSKIRWTDRRDKNKVNSTFEHDKTPFIIKGTLSLNCRYGKNWHLKSSIEKKEQSAREGKRQRNRTSIKQNCPAGIVIRKIIKFPDYKIPDMAHHYRDAMARRLQCSLRRDEARAEQRYYLEFAAPSEHKGHLVMQEAIDSRKIENILDPLIMRKVEHLLQDGNTDTLEITKRVRLYAKKELFAGQTRISPKQNRKFFPTKKHVQRAVDKILFGTDESLSDDDDFNYMDHTELPDEQAVRQVLRKKRRECRCLIHQIFSTTYYLSDENILQQLKDNLQSLFISLKRCLAEGQELPPPKKRPRYPQECVIIDGEVLPIVSSTVVNSESEVQEAVETIVIEDHTLLHKGTSPKKDKNDEEDVPLPDPDPKKEYWTPGAHYRAKKRKLAQQKIVKERVVKENVMVTKLKSPTSVTTPVTAPATTQSKGVTGMLNGQVAVLPYTGQALNQATMFTLAGNQITNVVTTQLPNVPGSPATKGAPSTVKRPIRPKPESPPKVQVASSSPAEPILIFQPEGEVEETSGIVVESSKKSFKLVNVTRWTDSSNSSPVQVTGQGPKPIHVKIINDNSMTPEKVRPSNQSAVFTRVSGARRSKYTTVEVAKSEGGSNVGNVSTESNKTPSVSSKESVSGTDSSGQGSGQGSGQNISIGPASASLLEVLDIIQAAKVSKQIKLSKPGTRTVLKVKNQAQLQDFLKQMKEGKISLENIQVKTQPTKSPEKKEVTPVTASVVTSAPIMTDTTVFIPKQELSTAAKPTVSPVTATVVTSAAVLTNTTDFTPKQELNTATKPNVSPVTASVVTSAPVVANTTVLGPKQESNTAAETTDSVEEVTLSEIVDVPICYGASGDHVYSSNVHDLQVMAEETVTTVEEVVKK